MSTQHKTNLFAFLHVTSLPVKTISHALHAIVPHNRRLSRFLIGITVILTGSILASVDQHLIPHFLWDAFAWLIHGIGSAPIIEAILKAIATEE